MLKSRLQKLDGLKYENIQKVISEIPKEKYMFQRIKQEK